MSAIPVKVTDASVRECVLWANLAIRGLDTNAVGTSMTVAINEAYDRWLAEVAKAAKVEALRDFAESHLYDGDRDVPLPGYTKAMQVADRIEAGEGA